MGKSSRPRSREKYQGQRVSDFLRRLSFLDVWLSPVGPNRLQTLRNLSLLAVFIVVDLGGVDRGFDGFAGGEPDFAEEVVLFEEHAVVADEF